MDAINHKHSLLDNHYFRRRSMSAGLPFLKNFRRGERAVRSRNLSFSFASSLVQWVVFHSTPNSSRALTFHCLLSPLLRFPLPSDLLLATAAPEAGGGLVKTSFRRDKCFSRIFCSKHRTTIFVGWCSLAIHLFEQHLECTETAMASAALTVEADCKINSPEFPRRVASSSRSWFRLIAS